MADVKVLLLRDEEGARGGREEEEGERERGTPVGRGRDFSGRFILLKQLRALVR